MIGSFCQASVILLTVTLALSAIEDMIDSLHDLVRVQARPFLGICVGMQLLADLGNEGGTAVPGLGWIPGDVVHLGGQMDQHSLSALKIPHMGWNHLQLHQPNHPVLAKMRTQMQVYFVHSYIFQLAQPSHCLATAYIWRRCGRSDWARKYNCHAISS